MLLDFYSTTGDVVSYLADNRHFHLWDGKAVAYLAEDRVFAFDGRQLGWLENGWLYDRANMPALFSVDAFGGPARPLRKARPVRSVAQRRPPIMVRQAGLARPRRSFEWSPVASIDYFDQHLESLDGPGIFGTL